MTNDTPRYNLNLSTQNLGRPLCQVHSKGIRSRVLNALFGGQNRLMIIVPEGCVQSISFTEAGKGCEAGARRRAEEGCEAGVGRRADEAVTGGTQATGSIKATGSTQAAGSHQATGSHQAKSNHQFTGVKEAQA